MPPLLAAYARGTVEELRRAAAVAARLDARRSAGCRNGRLPSRVIDFPGLSVSVSTNMVKTGFEFFES